MRHRPADRGEHGQRALQHDVVAAALDRGLDQQLVGGQQRVAVDAARCPGAGVMVTLPSAIVGIRRRETTG